MRPYTMAGLARALGCNRNTLLNYEDEAKLASLGPEAAERFIGAVKMARLRVEQWTEERLYSKGHPAGPIFSLKNNFGWKDQQEIAHTYEAVFTRRSEADQALFEPPVIDITPLSPTQNTAIALSPARSIAVSDARSEAKATPIEGVSPCDVA